MDDDNIYNVMEMKNAELICKKEKIDDRNNIINNFIPIPNKSEFRSSPMIPENNFCAIKSIENNILSYSDSIGYECLTVQNTLLLYPDRICTFHNYPVYEDDTYCSKNHQIYNNLTRRRIQLPNYTPKQSDFKYEKIPELKYHECMLGTNDNSINVPFSCICKQ